MNWKRGKGGALILDGKRIGFYTTRPAASTPQGGEANAAGVPKDDT